MKRWTIFTMVYNDYELLRDFVNSVNCHLNPLSWERILILDDYSRMDTKLRDYENFLASDSRFEIINFPEYRTMRHYMEEENHREPNLGHGAGFNLGVSRVETDFMIYLDVDCIFLEKSYEMLDEMTALFETNPDIMAAGQLFGTNGRAIYNGNFKFFHGPAERDSLAGGSLGPSSGAFRMSGWREKKLAPLETRRLPNLLTKFSADLFRGGYKIASYPWFTEMKILHLGRGVVRRYAEEKHGRIETDWFVFCKDFHVRHGPRLGSKDLRSNHYGRGFVDMTSRQYREYLRVRGEKPFKIVNPALNEERFVYTVD